MIASSPANTARVVTGRRVCATLLALALALALGPLAGRADACPPSARPAPVPVLNSAAAALKAGRPLQILAIGSSSTAGVGASATDRTYPSQLAQRLADALGPDAAVVFNAGVSGESAPATLKRLAALVGGAPKPDLVIWQVGTNDVAFGGTPERLAQNVAAGLDIIRRAGAVPIIIDQQYYPALRDVPRYEIFVATVARETAARNVTLLRRYDMMKQWASDDPKGFAGLFWWDKFHMSDAGYACLATLLADAIVEGLKFPASAEAPRPRVSGATQSGALGRDR